MKKDAYRLAGIAVALIAALVLGASYYQRTEREKRAADEAKKPAPAAATLVRPHSHSFGPKDAKVTVVEFFDPECESCRAVYPIIKQLVGGYGGRVRLVYRYMPLHQNSLYAASALEAAAEQGRYFDMLDVLFENQPIWGSHHDPKPQLIPEYAKQIGLDMAAFDRSMNSAAHKALVEMDRADAQGLGVTGTPTFFVNGRRLEELAFDPLKKMIEEELAKP